MLRCPNCRCGVAFEKVLFRRMRCKTCDSTLLVSQTYIRALVLLGIAAEALLWATSVRKLFYSTLGVPFGFLPSLWRGFPVAFVILTVMLRTVPRLVTPSLVPRHWGTVTTLDPAAEHDPTAGKNRGQIGKQGKLQPATAFHDRTILEQRRQAEAEMIARDLRLVGQLSGRSSCRDRLGGLRKSQPHQQPCS
jgi:hypothetical protein